MIIKILFKSKFICYFDKFIMERGEKVPYLKKIFELEQYGYKFDKK